MCQICTYRYVMAWIMSSGDVQSMSVWESCGRSSSLSENNPVCEQGCVEAHSETEFHGRIEEQILSSPLGKTQQEHHSVYNSTVYLKHFLDSQTHEHFSSGKKCSMFTTFPVSWQYFNNFQNEAIFSVNILLLEKYNPFCAVFESDNITPSTQHRI